jgi:imidazolonepropionase
MNATDNQKHGAPAPWDTLWIHAHLATMAGPGYGAIENGAIGIRDGHIAWVGQMSELPAAPQQLAAEVHDARHGWFTPGLIDCHTHLVYSGLRAEEFAMRLQGKSYADISKAGGGINSTVRATRAASEEELLRESEKRLRALLREGITTIEIKSGYGLDMPNEMKMLRVARRLGELYPVSVHSTFLGAHSLPPEYAGKPDAYIALLCEQMLPAIAREELASAVDGFCDSIAFSAAQMKKVFDAAQRLGLAVKLHAGQLSDQGGVELAAQYKALSADHLEHVSEEGIHAMGKAGTVAVLLPGAFYMLRETHKPPVALLRQHNVPMALATDSNPGTSPVCSLLMMLNMGCVLFGLTPEEALQGVTCHAARALGIGNTAGTLETGRAADLAWWDITHPAELSYHLGYNPCLGVIKGGQFRATQETPA